MQHEEISYSNEKINLSIWKKIFRIILKEKTRFFIAILAMFFLAALEILIPIINKYSIEKFFIDQDYSQVSLFAFVYALVSIIFMLCVVVFIRVAGKIEAEVGYEIRKESFLKLQELPYSYYDKTQAGWIMARVTSDSRKVSEIVSWGIVDIAWGLFSMVGTLIIIFVYEWRLGIIVLICTPVLYLIAAIFHKKILKSYREVRKTNSKITASYNESLLGSKTTKTLVLEKTHANDFENLARTMKQQTIRAIIISSLVLPLLVVVAYIAIAFILPIGALIGSVTLLYLVINYTIFYFEPVSQVARVLAEFQQAQASAERIMMLLETKVDIVDRPEVIEKYGDIFNPKKENWEAILGDIEFKNVDFSYIKDEIVLKDFNLKVKKGTSVAIVGTTGSGKSTIVNLLCRFYEPSSGYIEIDGKDYRERSIAWLHSNIGYVLQTPHLFNGTILENIRYGRQDASDEEVINAAKIVSAHEFIDEFENKYDTNVGEGGGKLSVGQRQLISFARAIVANPQILVLDEATSSIDTKTEYNIQEVINKLLRGRTSFIVAHRLSTIINADTIIVISGGKIIEQGTHKELLEKEGEYYHLYKNQFIDEQMEKTKY